MWLIALAGLALADAPRVELYTMGPGDDMFSRFGHAAICVIEPETTQGRCYNYGTTDFTTPVPLSWDVLRGHAVFWVSTTTVPAMLRSYRASDRTIYRQPLPLSEPTALWLAAALARDARPENRRYLYDHLSDNCSTRVRDHIDAATGGALRADQPHDRSLRQLVEEGLGQPGLVAASRVVLGRRLDAPIDTWEAMFLPWVLREQVQRRLGVAPQVMSRRQATSPAPADPRAGRQLAWLLATLFGGLGGLGLSLRLQRGRAWLALPTLLPGLVAALLWSLAAISAVPELRYNEALWWLWPSDLLLPWLSEDRLRAYIWLRLGCLMLGGLGLLAGLWLQPLPPAWMALLLCLPPVLHPMGRTLRDRLTGRTRGSS